MADGSATGVSFLRADGTAPSAKSTDSSTSVECMATENEPLNASRAPLRLAIIDDYELIVAGLASAVSELGPQVRVVELMNRLPAVSDVDVLLVDTFAMVSGGAYDVATLSRHARETGAKLAVYSWVVDPGSVQRALAQGADGYLWKGLSTGGLLVALESVRAGQVVTPPSDAVVDTQGDAAEAGTVSWPGQDFDLSPREAEVLALIAKGLSNEQIARELFLGINTVKTYIRTGYRKIGVASRTQAVLWALDHGFALQAKRAFPAAGGDGLDAAGYLETISRAPALAQADPDGSGAQALRQQLAERAGQVRALVPACSGISLASVLGEESVTLAATSDEIALLDATQYLSGGPCVAAAEAASVLTCTAEQLAAESSWRRFAAATATAGVTSVASLPVTDPGTDRVVGTVNLYASDERAFEGRDGDLADLFGDWAPAAVARHDAEARERPELGPQHRQDDLDIQVATALVADQEELDLDQARTRLDDAARRAGITVADLARAVREVGVG
jgi:NarL family two-component system response regulator LiaR